MVRNVDVVLIPDRLTVVLFELGKPVLEELGESLAEAHHVQVATAPNMTILQELLLNLKVCLIVVHVGQGGEISQAITVLQLVSKVRKDGLARVIITLMNEAGPLDQRLRALGASDVFPIFLGVKSLTFKIGFQIHALAEKSGLAVYRGVSEGEKLKGIQEYTSLEKVRGVRFGPELVLPDWATPQFYMVYAGQVGGAKYREEGWRVRMKGPAPELGKWVEAGKDWSWEPRGRTGIESSEKTRGVWIARGRKPEFLSGFWIFDSTDPLLQFSVSGEVIGTKFKVSELGALWVASDPTPESLNAMTSQASASATVSPAAENTPLRVVNSNPDYQGTDADVFDFPFQGLRGASPLAMAAVVSEIASRSEWSAVRMAQLFCQCIHQACAVGEVELYFLNTKTRQWILAGSSTPRSREKGIYSKWIQEFERNSSLHTPNALLVPFRTTSNFHWGTLVIAGGDLPNLDKGYARSLSKLGVGILRTFVMGGDRRPGPQA